MAKSFLLGATDVFELTVYERTATLVGDYYSDFTSWKRDLAHIPGITNHVELFSFTRDAFTSPAVRWENFARPISGQAGRVEA
eukprot:CAMPEP_0171732106 /NCGR_PEP_ID=MMETSP0991-20121206/29361_1 /TAXON_ID=483369 /ORGANISM="non described non described, Strain CCMP2098" /LENGTH=82 /DNA_ID=CAMNT_0012327311 /DNA_START=1085 /DNA_END=1329 /DNA_ORIENTATION=-